jgi:hypothetical protein
MSGVKTKIIPEQIAERNITTAAGRTEGSKTSFQETFNKEKLKFTGF